MDRMTLGKFIAKRRRHMRLTQGELAEKIHVSKSAIAKWETDAGIPDRDNLQRLSKAIGVSVDDLHKIIGTQSSEDVDLQVNITPEVISTLESYGYKVIRPGGRCDDK